MKENLGTSYEIKKIEKPTKELIGAYKDVFNNSAWEEWVKCSNWCWYKSTFEGAWSLCPECGAWIEDFYSDEDVSKSINDVLWKEYNKALYVKQGDNVKWFSWWWWDDLPNINSEKLWLSKEDYKKLEKELDRIWISPEKKQFYLSEMWITLEWRWKGLWKVLFWEIQDEIKEEMDWVLRTSKKSPMYKMSLDLWYEPVFDYKDIDSRVILASKNT